MLSGTLQAWNGVLSPLLVNSSQADTQVKWATCVIDVHQAIFYLAQAGTFIKFATLDCPNATEREDKLACAADISVAVNSFFWTASYVAATINSCQVVQSIDAACVASLNGVLAELGEFAFVAVSVVEVCEVDDEDKSDYWHYKEYYDKKHGIGKKDDYEKYYAQKYQDEKHSDKKALEEKHHDEKHQPKPYSAPPAKTAPRLPSPSEAAKFIAESAAKVKDSVEKYRQGKQLQAEGKMQPQEHGEHQKKKKNKQSQDGAHGRKLSAKEPQGHDGHKKPQAPQHHAEHGDAGAWMKPPAWGQPKKPEGHVGHEEPKAPAGAWMKPFAWGQPKKPEGHDGHEKPKAPAGAWMKPPAWGQPSDQKKPKAPEHQAGVLDWLKPPALGHLDKQQGHDGPSKAKAPEHQNGQGEAVDWMKLAAPGQKTKQEQRADLSKAWEGMKQFKDGVDGTKVAAWLEHMKEEQEEAKEKYAVQSRKSQRNKGGKAEEDGDGDDGDVEDDGRRGARITQCVIDVNLGLSFLARAGLQIYALTQSCPSYEQDKRKTCAIDIFNVISSFAWGAQFLAQIAVDCPEIGRQRAACAAVVSDFVAIIAALGPLVNGITDDCPYYSGKYEGALPPGYGDFFGASR